MSELMEPQDPAAALVDASGKRPARRREMVSDKCPGRDGTYCGASPDKRVEANGGFGGKPHLVCTQCGHEFKESS